MHGALKGAALGSQPGSECQRVPDLLGPEPIEIDRPAVPESKSHRRTSRQVEAFFSRCLRETRQDDRLSLRKDLGMEERHEFLESHTARPG